MGNTSILITEIGVGAHKGSYRIQGREGGKWKVFGVRKDLKKALKAAKDRALAESRRHNRLENLTPEEEALLIEVLDGGITVDDVRKIAAEKKRVDEASLLKVLDHWFEARTERNDFSAPYVRELNYIKKNLPKHLGNPMFWEITTQQLDGWLASLKVSPKRFKDIRGNLVGLWNWAISPHRYTTNNVAQDIEVPKIKRRSGGHEVLSPCEFSLMLELVPENFLPWLTISGFAGLRMAEVCGSDGRREDRLTWEDFDWIKKRIIVRPETSKTNKSRIIPICDALVEWLKPWAKSKGFVHTSRYPNNPLNKKTPSVTKLLGAATGGWRSNCLRASRASYRLAETNDPKQTAREGGHSVVMLETQYDNPRFREDAELWFSLTPAKVKELNEDRVVDFKQA